MGDTEVGFTVAFVVTMLVALVGNTLLIYIVWKKPETRTLTSFMFVNMAVADLLTTLLQMPITISFLLDAPWIPGLAGTITCKCFYYATFTSITASILCLTIIAVDRFFAVLYPFHSIGWFRKAQIVSPIIWIVSLALMSVSVTFIILDEDITMCSYYFREAKVSMKGFFTLFFVVNYLVPLVIMSVLYGAIIYKLWSYKALSTEEGRNNQEEQQKKKQLVRMLVIVVAVFALCWLPTNVYQLELGMTGDTSFSNFGKYISFLLSQGNSAMNPWLYIGLNRKFRQIAFSCTSENQNSRREKRREEVKLQRRAMQREVEREDSDSFQDKL
ncbi:pyroglutamylated RFamide peptide receptor-like [Orbicella faveolata]|uniref:pyroglutamylated RFamide peptide receptor-like n=1 Tax=Orbicella faveolata TaxID=48498 RepID=UPI0009E47A16|nr:pyroglutamylated RFamide peptide receptor-like [Orbicella faveolata]